MEEVNIQSSIIALIKSDVVANIQLGIVFADGRGYDELKMLGRERIAEINRHCIVCSCEHAEWDCAKCEMPVCDNCTEPYNQFSQIDYTCCTNCGSYQLD